MAASIAYSSQAQAQFYWDGGESGGGTSWATSANWVDDTIPVNSATSQVVINNRNNPGTISSMSISANRTLGLITFDNINSVLASTLNIDTNFSGTSDRTLTLHSGVTLANTNTTVAFRGNNGVLSMLLGADNVFTTSADSYLQFNSGVVISGGFGGTIAGSGSVGLNAQNTFSGGVTVQGGTTLRIGAATQGSSASSTVSGGVLVSGQVGVGTLDLQDGATLVSGGTGQRTLQNNLTLSGTVTFGAVSNYTGAFVFNSSIGTGVGEALSTPATITLLGNTTVNSNVTTSLFNVMSGAFSLTKQGPGLLRVSATNTYGGGTVVASGVLEFGRTGSLGSGLVTLGRSGGGDASLLNYLGGWTLSNNVVVAGGSGGTLTLGYTSLANFSGVFEGSITLNDHLTLRSEAVDGFAMRITGAINGAFNLTKTGAGMVRIEANNTGYSGTTTISNGTLQLGSFAGSANGSIGNGEIINNATLRINRNNAFSLSNLISGSGVVTHTGSGTTTLSNANTYSGGTTVTAGTLLVSNASGSATGTGSVSVQSGATLGGTGSLAPSGLNSIQVDGVVAPGLQDGIGALTWAPENGNATFLSTSRLLFQLGGDGDNDRLNFAPTGTGVMHFSEMLPGSIQISFLGGYVPSLGHRYDLIDWSELAMNGLSPSMLDLSGALLPDVSWEWDTSAFVSSGVISVTVIPEPGRLVLCLVGMVMWGLRRQRRVA